MAAKPTMIERIAEGGTVYQIRGLRNVEAVDQHSTRREK